MSAVLEHLRKSARARRRSIVFPETSDRRVIQAARAFAGQDLGTAILIDPPPTVEQAFRLSCVTSESLTQELASELHELRRHRGVTLDEAREALHDPLLVAAMMVRTGRADAAVAGSIATTANVVRAAIRGIGVAEKGGLVSSLFLMEFGDHVATYADCGVVPDPNDLQLAQIAINAADSHFKLTSEEPRIAMLSFSTLGSASQASARKVQRATEIVRAQRPDLLIDGELQFDAAICPEVAKRKAPNSPISGQANVLVFPNLDAGNIGYKIAERIGGATAIGPILQGLAKPMMDLSRGCKPSDIVDVAVVAANLV